MKTIPRKHELKTLRPYYQRVLDGTKRFEVRKNDRDFQTGDHVSLLEYDGETSTVLETRIDAEITYVLQGGQFGIKKNYCVFGFKIL